MREFESLEDLGRRLQEIRAGREITLAEAARNLNVRENFLAAIEEGNLTVFPAVVYARGFIRNYLDYLGARELWENYDLAFSLQGGAGHNEGSAFAPPMVESPCLPVSPGFRRITRWWFYVFVGAITLFAVIFAWTQREVIQENLTKKPLNGEAQIAVRTTQPTSSGALSIEVAETRPEEASMLSGDPAAALLSGDRASGDVLAVSPDMPWIEAMRESPDVLQDESELVLRMSKACWIQVVRDKEVLFQGTVDEGNEKRFKLDREIRVRMGKSSAVTAVWGGTEKTFKKPGGTLTVFFLPDGTMREP